MYGQNAERRFLGEIQNKASHHIIVNGAAAAFADMRRAFGGGQSY